MPTLFVALLFAILIAVFALQNTVTVNVRFLVWEYETSLVLIILGSAMLGAILTFVASLGPRIRHARETRQLEQTSNPRVSAFANWRGSSNTHERLHLLLLCHDPVCHQGKQAVFEAHSKALAGMMMDSHAICPRASCRGALCHSRAEPKDLSEVGMGLGTENRQACA